MTNFGEKILQTSGTSLHIAGQFIFEKNNINLNTFFLLFFQYKFINMIFYNKWKTSRGDRRNPNKQLSSENVWQKMYDRKGARWRQSLCCHSRQKHTKNY